MLGTLTRAGMVLELFTDERPEWGVTEAAEELGIPKSKAHNMLMSLAEIGLLQRVPHGRYRLGWRTIALASTLLRSAALTRLAGPVMRDLVGSSAATAHLIVLEQGRLVCVDRRQGTGRARASAPAVGATFAVNGSASALVLQAGWDTARVERLWSERPGLAGHATVENLLRELQDVRRRGWACDRWPRPDAPFGTIAAPVHEAGRGVAAVLTLTVPELTASSELQPRALALVDAANCLSKQLDGSVTAAERTRRCAR